MKTRANKYRVFHRFDCGWSLYAPGASDRDIAAGTAVPPICRGAKWIASIG